MKKNANRRFSALLLVMTLTVALLWTACGGGPKTSVPQVRQDTYAASAPAASPENGMLEGEAADMAATGSMYQAKPVEIAQDSRKIIYEASIYMEALDYDASVAALLEAVQAAKGYVASTDLSNERWEGAFRRAQYVFRVPTEQYSTFLQALGEAGNVTAQQESTQDITAEYVDVEARLKSLRVQEERLMSMLEAAGELETLLAIQNQLTEVQYQIESYTARQRTFDAQVAYSTVTVTVEEVRHITEQKDSFAQRIGGAFTESWRDFGTGLQNFAIGFVAAIPTLLVLAVLAGLVFWLVLAVRKRVRAHAAKHPTPMTYAAPRAPQQAVRSEETEPKE